jgi:tetratricopeptide (TPR) repeat protein
MTRVATAAVDAAEAASADAPRYWAFLSYSHADLRWARWLHRALEGYAIPRRMVGRPTPAGPAPRRLRPIFRDLDDMGAGHDLSDRLKRALAASANLIVICSPEAAASTWVDQEIRLFKALHGEERVFAVIVGGEPFASERAQGLQRECFPPAIFHRLADGTRGEPVAADLRPRRDGRDAALLKLVSGLLGVDLDELARRDAQRRNRQLVALASVSTLVAAAMGALAVTADLERDQARRERAAAEGLVEFMIGDLRGKLQPAGRLDILDAIGARAQAYYAGASPSSLDADSLGRHARVLHLLGDIQKQRGDLPAALALFQQAAKSTGEILKRRPDDPQAIYDHAQSVAYIGEVAVARDENAAALQEFETYQALARRLVALDPAKADWQAEVSEADTDVGVTLLRQARAEEAARDFQDALAISARLAAAAPAKRERQWDESQILAWLADAEVERGRLDAALADRTAEAHIYEALIAASPHDSEAGVALASNRAAIARIQLAAGMAADATITLTQAAASMDQLMRETPDDAVYKSNAEGILVLLAQALLQQDRLTDAAPVAQRAVDLCEAQVRSAEARHDEAIAWRGAWLGDARITAMKIAAAGAPMLAAQRPALAAAPGEAARLRGLLALHPRSHALARTASEAALLAGDAEALSGRPARARQDWTWAQSTLSKAAPTASATDRTPLLLRQANYRLSTFHPPAGPLPASPAGRTRTAPPATRTPADYRW